MSEVRMPREYFQEVLGLVEQYMPRSAPFCEGSESNSHDEYLFIRTFWLTVMTINPTEASEHSLAFSLPGP